MKNKREERKEFRSPTSDAATATSSPATRSHRGNARKRVRMGHGEVKRLPACGVDG